jgi:hypothetical protein
MPAFKYNANDSNKKVYATKSKIAGGGKGLFAKVAFQKGDFICTYGGKLIDPSDAKYTDPTYIADFEPGKGFKLVGDNEAGDMGHFANAIHPDDKNLKQNARFNFTMKKTLPNLRGIFPLYAAEDIKKNEEIIVNYGVGYWVKMEKWIKGDYPTRDDKVLARNERALKRSQKSS